MSNVTKTEALKQALLGLKHRDVDGHPCFCLLWPDEESHCEEQEHCVRAQKALGYPNPQPVTINLTDKRLLELLDIARFQRDMTKQRLYQLETIEGPAVNYKEKKVELMSAQEFWQAIVDSCKAPVEQAKVDGPTFNLGRSEGRADVAAELRRIIDPNDEQHLSLDGTLDIVRKLVNLL
jgi:hypothetical protein